MKVCLIFSDCDTAWLVTWHSHSDFIHHHYKNEPPKASCCSTIGESLFCSVKHEL